MAASPKMSVMSVSPPAAERVRALLANAQSPQAGLRVSVEKGGCAGMSYKMDIAEPQPGDEIIDSDGARVIVDAKAVLYLLGTTMDLKTTQFSSTFVFENPNQTSACGCGESVELKPADPAEERAALANVRS
jgi:iron-sulfur cluster assembly protein